MSQFHTFIFRFLIASAMSVAVLSRAEAEALVVNGDLPPAHAITVLSDFSKPCIAYTSGYEERADKEKLVPIVRRKLGECDSPKKPFVFAVTHENDKNNHRGAKNFDPRITSYMADFDYEKDIGRWLRLELDSRDPAAVVSFGVNTINRTSVNVTGWPIQYGHMFVALADPSAEVSLNKNVIVEFSIRVREDSVAASGRSYSGRRVLLGALAQWSDLSPRTNRSHFFELDFLQSDGYTESYNEPKRPGCADRVYDRCFYDDGGKYAEGRELRYDSFADDHHQFKSGEWNHIRIPVSQAVRKLKWISPPNDWAGANLSGLYFAVESTGDANVLIDLKGYRLYVDE